MKFALIAHDNKKANMVAFVSKRLPFFNREDVSIVTTGTTGKHVMHAGIRDVEVVNSGPLGGDAEIHMHSSILDAASLGDSLAKVRRVL